jgi:hypothetical protein
VTNATQTQLLDDRSRVLGTPPDVFLIDGHERWN